MMFEVNRWAMVGRCAVVGPVSVTIGNWRTWAIQLNLSQAASTYQTPNLSGGLEQKPELVQQSRRIR